MVSVKRAVKPNMIRQFCARTSAITDWSGFMLSQGANGKHPHEIEGSWLVAKGGSGNGLNALWGSYLASKGVNTGSLKERMQSWFTTGSQA